MGQRILLFHSWQIKKNKYNALIIATDKGLNKFIPKYEKFEPFYNQSIIKNEIINCFTTDSHNNLFLATLRNKEGLYLYVEQLVAHLPLGGEATGLAQV